MREPNEIEELIYQSIKESDLFDGKWEGMFYSNLLNMILTKGGGVEEFLQHYTPYFDSLDLEWFWKEDLIGMYGEDGYQLFIEMIWRD